MKKIITLSICLLVITSSIASTYGNIDLLKRDAKNKSEITLTLNDVEIGQRLSIKDKKGTSLFNTTIKNEGTFNNRFDFSALPSGTYHFEHETESLVKHIPFTVKYNGEIVFDKANEKTVYKPYVSVKENHIFVSKLDLEKEAVEIDIYFAPNSGEKYQLLHSENITDTMKIERVYRLSQKHEGNYKIIINADGQKYVEHVKI